MDNARLTRPTPVLFLAVARDGDDDRPLATPFRAKFRRDLVARQTRKSDIKQDKTPASIPELKSAAELLKGQDDQQYSIALYRLGFAYAKLNKVTEARDVLTEAAKIDGPVQAMSRELLTKVNAARAKGK